MFYHLGLSVLVAVHLVSVNIASAGPLLSIWHEWKEGRGDQVAGRAGRALLVMSIAGTLIGAALGLIAGWLVWDDGLAAATRRVPSKIHFGVWELLFSLVLTTAQWWWWCRVPHAGPWLRVVRGLLALLASTNLLYHFPVLFAVLTEMIHRGDLAGTLDASGFRRELVRGAVIARAVHFLLAAVATCGLALMLFGHSRRTAVSDVDRHRLVQWGARWALLATVLQVPAGLWLVLRLSPQSQQRLMGGDVWTTMAFGLALLIALWLAHMLAAAAFGETNRRQVYRSAAAFLIVIWLMTSVSQRAFAPTHVPTSDSSVTDNF